MTPLLRPLGRVALGAARGTGAGALLAARVVRGLARMDRRELGRGFVQFGLESVPLALVTAAVTGATVVVQTGLYVERFGARQILGWAAGYAVLWEFGPLLLGLVMAGRLGARNAAELATLQVGGQLEGLRGLSLDPYALLVAPRVVAMSASVTGLAAGVFAVAVLTEALSAWATLGLPMRVFLESFADGLRGADFAGGLLKCGAFGLAIALVSSSVGVRARGGARAVGRAAASAVVASCAAIFTLDLLLTALLSRVLA